MDIKRVDKSGAAKGVKGAARVGGASKGQFAALLDEVGAATSGAVGAINPLNALESLLSIQEAGDAMESEGKSKQRAEQLLDQMDELRISVLDGDIPRYQLENLSRMAQSRREEVNDPALKAVLDEIDLRAQVELAKYTPTNLTA